MIEKLSRNNRFEWFYKLYMIWKHKVKKNIQIIGLCQYANHKFQKTHLEIKGALGLPKPTWNIKSNMKEKLSITFGMIDPCKNCRSLGSTKVKKNIQMYFNIHITNLKQTWIFREKLGSYMYINMKYQE